MIHSFTVSFGEKYLTGMATSVPPGYETFSLIKNNIFHPAVLFTDNICGRSLSLKISFDINSIILKLYIT
jgi:hypothetical protein